MNKYLAMIAMSTALLACEEPNTETKEAGKAIPFVVLKKTADTPHRRVMTALNAVESLMNRFIVLGEASNKMRLAVDTYTLSADASKDMIWLLTSLSDLQKAELLEVLYADMYTVYRAWSLNIKYNRSS